MSAHATSYYMLTPIANVPAQQGPGTQSQPDIAVSLTSYALPSGQVGVPYTGFDFKPLLFVTGDATYSGTGVGWSVASGSLPAGLTLNANGTLSGTPTTAGNSTFEIKASYKTKTGKQAYQVAVVSVNVALATATPNSAQVGLAYQYDLKPLLTVNGDTNFNANNVTWSVVSSTLPAGLSLRTDGTISGTPTASGSGTVTARATYLNAQGEQTYQVVSHEITVSLASATVPQGLVGQPFNYNVKPLLSVKTDGSTTANVTPTWSVSAGALPAGLTLNADGTITGTPTTASNSNVTLRATYSGINGEQTYQFVTLNVTVALATATPTTAQVGVAYQYDLKPLLTVNGDVNFNANNVTWSVVSSTLPAGLVLRSDGLISGTPTAYGSGTVTARATYQGVNGEQTYQVVSHEITVSLASATVPQGLVGQAFNYDVKPLLSIKTDGTTTTNATPTWSVSAGTLPAGLTLNADGTITGTPTAASNSNVTLRATYSGVTADKVYSLNVVVTDPFINQVVLLAHGDAPVVDSSLNHYSVIPSSSGATISSSVTKFGNGSMSFDGWSNYAIGTIGGVSNLDLGAASSWTIEGWLNTSSANNNTTNHRILAIGKGSSWWESIALTVTNTTLKLSLDKTYGVAPDLGTLVGTLPSNTWAHFAAVFNGTTYTLYINGVASQSLASTAKVYTGVDRVYLGMDTNPTGPARDLYAYKGYLDDLRITSGIARYSANFTIPSAAYPD